MIYELPWFSKTNGLTKTLLHGFNVAGTYTYETGERVTVRSGNDANLNGGSFVPGPGQVLGILIPEDGAHGRLQDTLLEVTAPECGLIGDFVWQDTNSDGLQSAGEPGINGVTVKLTDANGNLLQTAVTGFTPAGYTFMAPGTPGYYQFKGLCAGTYKVVIDNNQAALGGYTPTIPNGGGGGNTTSNPANESSPASRSSDGSMPSGGNDEPSDPTPPTTVEDRASKSESCSSSRGRDGSASNPASSKLRRRASIECRRSCASVNAWPRTRGSSGRKK